jgi:hypothetical protein
MESYLDEKGRIAEPVERSGQIARLRTPVLTEKQDGCRKRSFRRGKKRL